HVSFLTCSLSLFFFFYCSGDHRYLHSFPTRRSSDLDVLPRTPGNNVYVGFMVWSNFTATKCRGLVSLNQVIKEIINLIQRNQSRSEERFSRNAETDLVCRLLLEKKKESQRTTLDYHI